MDLLNFFCLIVKYNMPFTNKESCLRDISQWFCNNGGVWQKFAQVLSQYEDVIGEELAHALGKMCFECPAHDDKYSARIIKDAFGDTYDTSDMKMIGSGTISQVYKTRVKDTDDFVAIKVMHPTIKKEIREACDSYNNIKTSMFFPGKLIMVCNVFFTGLKEQLEMTREFKHGRRIKQMLQPTPDGDHMFIIPAMLEHSKKCLVMEYKPSKIMAEIDVNQIDPLVLSKVCNGVQKAIFSMIIHGLIHGDLHYGNYGVCNETSPDECKIVLYDYGQCFDIGKLELATRNALIVGVLSENIAMLRNNIIPVQMRAAFHSLCKEDTVDNFVYNMEVLIRFIFSNRIDVDDNLINTIVSISKIYRVATTIVWLYDSGKAPNINAHLHKHGILENMRQFYPQEEFRILQTLKK